MSLATGGGGNYADNASGFLGDFVAYVTTSSNATHSYLGPDRETTIVRYGDYFSVRNATTAAVVPYSQGTGYGTLGYGCHKPRQAKRA